jgi:1-hydroxycarotenoid 3,4-desaturase
MQDLPVAVIGAGIGGLSAALALAVRGIDVVVWDQAAQPGGKMRSIEIDGRPIDAGPTVFTMRDIFDEMFDEAGTRFSDEVTLEPLQVLARHAWDAHARLDLYADRNQSAEAIAAFSSPAEGRRYLAFCEQARKTFETLNHTFIRAQKPNPLSLTQRTLAEGLGGIRNIKPFGVLWDSLRKQFHDPRLQQLFGRYATYCGSSPYQAPATLMLVAHVEQEGVWRIAQGMHGLARALRATAERCGVRFVFGRGIREIVVRNGRAAAVVDAEGETTACSAVISNADPSALAQGHFGDGARRATAAVAPKQRSLSALTWSLLGRTDGFPLAYHNVFFSTDYRREFDDIFDRRKLPQEPTVYVCAQDRNGDEPDGEERLFCLANAPAVGDIHRFSEEEIDACLNSTRATLKRCGLNLSHQAEQSVVTTPNAFERFFPGSGGALYGQASHGWRASFTRPGARTAIKGLYLAGGATHPGPGVPMAALSGRLAVQSLLADRPSTASSPTTVMPGGTSTP